MTDPTTFGAGDFPDGAAPDGLDVTGLSMASADMGFDGFADAFGFALDLECGSVPDFSQAPDGFDGDDVVAAAEAVWGDADQPVDAGAEVALAALGETYSDMAFPGYGAFLETHGSPAADIALWDPQDDPMSCAVAVTNSMFRSMGFDPGESCIAEVFREFGIYDPAGGTNFRVVDDAINIIAARNGLDVEACDFSGCSMPQLEAMLDTGVRPLIAVDGAELYAGSGERLLNDMGLLPNAPHAVQLTGIERTPQGDFAIINDPAVGGGLRVPLEVFADAAGDFGFSGVAMSDHAGIARVGAHCGNEALGADGSVLGSAFGAQGVRADSFGNLYRGSSLVPFSGPGAPGWKQIGNTTVFQS